MRTRRWIALALAAVMLLSALPAAVATPSTSGCRASANGKHNWILTDTIEASCNEPGYKYYYCEYCQARQTETVDPLGHKWVQRGEIDYTGCTSPMYVPYACTRCGDTKVEERPGPGHNWVEIRRSEGDCTNGGTATYRCSRCGDTKTERLSPNGKHSWGAWKTDEKATCTKKGLEVRKCTVCGKEEWRFTDMLPHEWGDWQTDTVTGAQVRLCKNCGAKDSGGDQPQPQVMPEHLESLNPQVTASSRVAFDAGQGKKYVGAQVPCDLVFTNTGNVPVYVTFEDQAIWDAIMKGSDPAPNGLTTVKNPLALGKTTGALLNPGEKLSWPYVAEVDADAAATGFLSFGFNAPFLYEDTDGVMKSASSTMGFVGVPLTGGSAPETKTLNPAVTASGRWAPDAGAGKRYEGAEVAYEFVLTNTGDTPVYICYDSTTIWNAIQSGNNPAPHGLETVKSPFYEGNTTAARLDPGETLSHPVTDTVSAEQAESGVYKFEYFENYGYYDLEGVMQSRSSSVGKIEIPLTAEANVSKPEGYDTVDLSVTAVMTSPAKTSYAAGDTLVFQVTLKNNSSFDMDAPSLRGDTLYGDGWEYQPGVDIRGYNGQTMGKPKLPAGDSFTVEDKYTVRDVDVERGMITIAWRGFGYPDKNALPSLPPEWSDPAQRPVSVEWDAGLDQPLYFRSDSFELTFSAGAEAKPEYDTEKLTLEMEIVGGVKSAYAVAETVYFEALMTNVGTVRYGATNIHFSYGDADSGAEFADLEDVYGEGLLPAESFSAMSSYTFTPEDEARGYVDLTADGYAVYTDAHWPSFPPEEEHIADFTGAEPVTIRLYVGEEDVGLSLTAAVVSGDATFLMGDQVAVFVAVTNTGKEPLQNPCAFINGESCMARLTVLEPGYTVSDVVFVKIVPEYMAGNDEEFLVEAAAWPVDSPGASGMPWKGGISALSDDAVITSPVLLAVPVDQPEEAALDITVSLTSENKESYVIDDELIFDITLKNVGNTVLEVPTILIDYSDEAGMEGHIHSTTDLGPGEQLKACFSHVIDAADQGDGSFIVTFGGQAWEVGAFDGTLDDYSYSEGSVQSAQVAFILTVTGDPGPIPKPKGDPVLTLYAEPKYPKSGYCLDDYNQTEEIPYLLTVANDGDAPFAFGELFVSIGGTTATVDPGLGVLYPNDMVEYTLTGTHLLLGDIIPGTDGPGMLGVAEVTFQYSGSRLGEEALSLWSNEAVVEHVILEGEPEPIPTGGTVWVFKTETSKPLLTDGYAENETIVYEIQVVNMTGRTLDTVAVWDILSNTGTDGTLIDTIHDMAPSESRTYVFEYVVTDFDAGFGYVKNKAYAEWTDPDTGDENRSYSGSVFSATVETYPEEVLVLTKFVDTDPPNGLGYFEVGDEITFRVEIDNYGDEDLENVFIYDPLIPEEEMGHTLASYSVLPAGGHETEIFTYTVQEPDLIPGYVINCAHAKAMDHYGNILSVSSPEVMVLVGETPFRFQVVEPLQVIKTVTSTPGEGRYYYKVGETITYDITVVNPDPNAEYHDIDVFDILATTADQKIGHIDYLGPNSKETVHFSYKVQDSDLPSHSVGNQASIAYENDSNLFKFNLTRVTIQSNWVYSRVNEKLPDPPVRRTPTPGDCCELTLTAHGAYALDYSQHFCADHAAVKARADAAVLSARTDAEKLTGWKTAQDIWRAELDKMYVKCMSQATGKEKAAVMDERAVFYLYLNSLEDMLTRQYADQPAKAAEIVAGLMRDRCAELCYLLHKAPGARRDSLSSSRYALLPGTSPSAVSFRSETTAGKQELLIHLALDAGLGQIEETLKTANDQAVTRAQHAQAFANAQALWRTAADRAFNARYLNANEDMRTALGLNRLLFDQLLLKREALLQILYPNQPDVVAEQLCSMLRDYAVMLEN